MAVAPAQTTISVGTLDELNGALAFVDRATGGSYFIKLTANILEGTSALLATGGTQLTYPDGLTDASGSNNATSLVNGTSISVPPRQDLYALNLNSGVTVTIDGANPAPGGQNFAIDGDNSTVIAGVATQGTTPTYRGLFVYAGAVRLSNLTIQNALARGGDGSSGGAGLGGGLFVAGTGNNNDVSKAAGGAIVLSGVTFLNNAAIGGTGNGNRGGGGGLGGSGDVIDGGGGGGVGGNGGTDENTGNGGDGIILGAGGGGSGAIAALGSSGQGGNFGGGGGGGNDGDGGGGGVGGGRGQGGFGGGGGGKDSGGFGGGGGQGGFGGGGRSNPGFGGGGGSGLGAGGAVFVQSGGTLTVLGTLADTRGAVAGGAGGPGQMFASGFYFQGMNGASALTFDAQDPTTGAATLQTVSDVIGDDTGSAAAANYTGSNSYMPGSVGVVKTGVGTLDLTAANTYTGGTVLNGGTLDLAGATVLNGTAIASAAAGTGAITFAAGSQTLRIEQAALTGTGTERFANTVASFGAPNASGANGDTIDLAGLVGGVASFNYSTDQLTVTGTAGGAAQTVTMQLSGDYTGEVFTPTPDGSITASGTAIRLVNVIQPAPTIGLAQDTGTSGTDRITSNPTVTGQDDAGAVVTIKDENNNTLDSFTGDGGTYSFDPTQLAQGAHTLTITETRAGQMGTASASFTYDSVAPTITVVTLDKAAYKLGDTVTATIQLAGTYDGDGAYALGAGSAIDGSALAAGSYDATNNRLTASFVVGANTPEVIQRSVPVNVTVDDAAGNASAADTTAVPNETIDTHAPTAVGVAGFTNGMTDTGKAPVAAGSVVGALSTTDASPNDSFTYTLSGNDAGRFAINSGVLDVSGTALTDGTQYAITVTSTDLGGNQYAQAVQVTGATTPTVQSIVPAGSSPTNAPSDPFTVTFSQAVTGVQASSFALSGTDGTGTIGTPTTADGGRTYTVPVTGVSGNGTLGLNLSSTAGIASTSTGTALGGTHASDRSYTIDTTLSTPTIVFAASNSAAGAADVNAAHAAGAGYTVGSVDADATATVTFTGTLKSTGASGTLAGNGTNGGHTVDLSGFRDGTIAASISDADTAGNARTGASTTTTLDTTPPTITTLADSGPNIAPDGSGDLNAGKNVTLTVTTSEVVTVTSGANNAAPTLTLNDGGIATYTGGSGTTQQMFSYTVAAGQNTAKLAVTAVNANGAAATDAAGNPLSTSLAGAAVPSGTLVIDTTAPSYGAGSATPAAGSDLGAGKVVTFTVQTSEPVTVTEANGGAPTLRLNANGETAAYTGAVGQPVSSLTFGYIVQPGDNAADLVAGAVGALPAGTTIRDGAGNDIDPSTFKAIDTGLQVDTTAPGASSRTVTVAQNSGATPIGIALPSDNLTPSGSLAIAAGVLPTDGTVALANGMPVAAGQPLTAAQLQGLTFTPTPGVAGQGSTFSYTVTDGAGNATQGTAALNVGAAGAPTITGTHATADQAEAPASPFAGVTVADPSAAAGAAETLTIALTGGGGALAGAGLVRNPDGSYGLAGTAAQVTQQLDALVFTPAAGAPGTTTGTTFVLTDRSGAGTSVTDAGTSVADTAAAAPPVQPPPVAPDTVSISPVVRYGDGAFTLTGTASSPAGVVKVEITADVNGTPTDLGAAAVGADGSFTFTDRIGARQQSFFVATETDGRSGTAASADPGFSLTGGQNFGSGYRARQFRYTADGTAETARSLFKPDGSQKAAVLAAGQTFASSFFDRFENGGAPLSTFVFDPGFGRDVVDLFRVDGIDHDTLSFKGSDYGTTPADQLAGVLSASRDTAAGLLITDPTASSPGTGGHDTLLLKGITKDQLAANRGDITFHG